jgi:hypothetical protein
MRLDELVGDWGGFEKLVAELHRVGDVTVEHNVTLLGRSGAPRQIDVLIRHRQGLYEHLVVVECKYWRQSVKRMHVDALATTVREVGAAKGVLFSAKGFQAGAITEARHQDIELYLLRDLQRHEWGRPGKIVDMFLHIVQISVGNIVISNATFQRYLPGPDPDSDELDISLGFGDGVALTSTPLLGEYGAILHKTLEDIMLEAAHKRAEQGLTEVGLFNGGAEGTYYLGCPTNMLPSQPIVIPRRTGIIRIPEISFTVGLRFDQSRITVDRSANLEFALAVESKVTGKIATVSRATNESSTILGDAATDAAQDAEQALVNGTVARVMLRTFFDFAEMSKLTPVPIDDVRGPLRYVDPNDGD